MEYWQTFEAMPQPDLPEVWRDSYVAVMPDGSGLALPLRDMGETAVAGLIANQASFAVFDTLAAWMVEIARSHGAEIVVGLPTLGHAFAAAVARGLGHANWVAPGTSRKLWYEDALSVPLASITSPAPGRRLDHGGSRVTAPGRRAPGRGLCRHAARRPLARPHAGRRAGSGRLRDPNVQGRDRRLDADRGHRLGPGLPAVGRAHGLSSTVTAVSAPSDQFTVPPKRRARPPPQFSIPTRRRAARGCNSVSAFRTQAA